MTEDYIRKHFNEITDWEAASKYGDFSYAFMREFADYLDFNIIIQYRDFNTDFLREIADKIKPHSFPVTLKEKVMIEFADVYDEWQWESISQYARPSKKFFKRYAEKVNWYSVITHQKGLDERFRRENIWRCNKREQEALREQFKFIHEHGWDPYG